MQKKLRQKIASLMFQREFRNHHTLLKTVQFERAKSIGILYDSTDEKYFELVKKYVKDIREQHHKEVLALGYYDQDELPPMRFSKLGLDFFTRKQLNYFLKPKATVVKNFINREFDILIDLHTANHIPFRYIVAQSKAKFKIGKYEKAATNFYDFMISTRDHVSLHQFIGQVNQYLNLFKHEHAS